MLFLFFKCVGLCTTGIDHGTQRTRSEVSHTHTHAHTHTHKRAREIFFFLSLSHSLPYLSLTTAFIFKHFTIKFKKKKNFQSVCIEAHVPRISPQIIPHHSDHRSPLRSPLSLSFFLSICVLITYHSYSARCGFISSHNTLLSPPPFANKTTNGASLFAFLTNEMIE